MTTVSTPMPGVFYRRPSPDADNFVEPGDSVTEGQTIGLIEIMKSFSELKASSDGVLKEFLVGNEDEVSIAQEIAVIE
jgi:acetyl-CoA carboxylase biotin carboxyl carrier protein